jgi:hypothetical protein
MKTQEATNSQGNTQSKEHCWRYLDSILDTAETSGDSQGAGKQSVD